MTHSKLDSALAHARAGWPVFPCHNIEGDRCSCGKLIPKDRSNIKPGECKSPGKHPHTRNGLKNATRDEERIRRWWKLWPNANPAGRCDGRVVVDADAGKGKNGMETLAVLERQHGRLERALVQRTGAGGLHIVFAAREGVKYPGKLGEHIETRAGAGGYIMLSGSDHWTGGEYTWEVGDGAHKAYMQDLPHAPDWMEKGRERKRDADGEGDLATFTRNRPCGFSREQIEYICRHTGARNDYDSWLRVGMMLHHESEGSDEGRDLWDSLCVDLPDYDSDEIEAKWKSFGRYTGEPLKMATLLQEAREHKRWDEDKFRAAGESDREDDEDESDSNSDFLPLLDWDAAAKVKPLQFLYGPAYTPGTVSGTIAPGGAGKTAALVTEALAMASGRDLFNIGKDGEAVEIRARNVCVWNCEDPKEEMHRRFLAAKLHFDKQLEGTDYRKRIRLKAAESPLTIGRVERGRVVLNEKFIEKTIRWVRKRKIDVLIVDPFIATHAVATNDNDAMSAIIRRGWAKIARETGCALHIAHHTRKGALGQTDFSVEDSLGAGAILTACRHVRVFNKMSKEIARTFGVAEDDAWKYLRVDNGKANLAPLDAAVWRKLEGTDLENGCFEEDSNSGHWIASDTRGVVVAWKPPDLSKTSTDERERILEAMGGKAWREDSRAEEDWIGVAFAKALKLDLDKPADMAAVKAKVKAAIKDGWFEETTVRDKHRHVKKALRAKQKRTARDLLGGFCGSAAVQE